MAGSSAKGAEKLLKPGVRPVSTSAPPGKDEGRESSHRHRIGKLKSWLNKPFDPTSSKTPSPPALTAALSIEKDNGDDHARDGLSRLSTNGNKFETSSNARSALGKSILSDGDPGSKTTTGRSISLHDSTGAVPIVELWNEAYEQLRKTDPTLVDKYEAEISLKVSTMVGATVAMSGLGKISRKEQMEVLVRKKLEENENGKWRIPLGHDRIAIRDLAGYVVSIVDWGKEFVGTALESSPYGSIAWAGVCLLLPLILNPSKQRASNICGLEFISDLLSRCTMYEDAYHQRYEIKRDGLSDQEPDLTSDGYKSALKELYLRILRFQARSVCQFSRSLVSGGVRAMFKMDDWDSLLEDIKSQEANCQIFFDSVKDQKALDAREEGHRQRTLLVLNKLEEVNAGIMGIRDKIEELHLSDQQKNCFEILATSDYRGRKDLNPERLPGTCKWFLEHPKYQAWKSQPPASRLLWVSANPGCGKSVLAKTLVDRFDRGSVCYYFFKDDTLITRSASHALCALLHQICELRPKLIDHVLPVYLTRGAKMTELFEDLWSIFVDIISREDFGNVVCILDAIDECSDNEQKKLLQRLAAIATSSTSIKILITSRPYTSIETALFYKTGLDRNEIHLLGEATAEQDVIEKEISFFITYRVQEFQVLRESKGIYDDVVTKLQNHLDGIKNRTYLWVSAIFNELERDVGAPEWVLMESIKALPDDVDKAYGNILAKSTKKPILTKVLHVMLAASRPLSLMEMNIVLSIQDTPSGPNSRGLYSENSFCTWLRDLCGFFVNIVDNELYFVHQTAREFLIGEEDNQAIVEWRGSFRLADSHTLLARICIDYLLCLHDGFIDAGFEFYATSHWPWHCQIFEDDQQFTEKIQRFLFHDGEVAPCFERWVSAARKLLENNVDRKFRVLRSFLSLPPTPLFLACVFGWSSVINALKTSKNTDWNQKNDGHNTGLHIAAEVGHVEIVNLFLTAGADVNAQSAGGETALCMAAFEGHIEIVELLLDAGADAKIQDDRKQTALHWAVKNVSWATKKDPLEIVKLLLKAGADVNTLDWQRGTALSAAASGGHLEAVKHLLTEDVDINNQDCDYYTPLHAAAFGGDLEIVKALLDAGASVNFREHFGNTPLYLALTYGHLEIVRPLLMAGADVNIRDCFEKPALHLAASEGYLEIVRLLLDAGADVNIQDRWKETAVHLAASKGYLEIVRLLLDAGADINIQDR